MSNMDTWISSNDALPPKDGTPFLAFLKKGECAVLSWQHSDATTVHVSTFCHVNSGAIAYFTHWQPSPDKPLKPQKSFHDLVNDKCIKVLAADYLEFINGSEMARVYDAKNARMKKLHPRLIALRALANDTRHG